MTKDFRKKTFTKLLRGYSPDEVDEYLAKINEEYRLLERKNSDSERKLALALKKLDEMRMLSAERESAENENNNARNTAESILAEATLQAEAILSAAKNEAEGIYRAASDMYDEVSSFRDSLFELYNNHIVSVESIAESAKLYIDKIDGTYSSATGEVVTHDAEDADDIEDDDIEEFSHEDDEDALVDEEQLHIDWKNRSVLQSDDSSHEYDNLPETRVLDLNLLINEDEEYADEADNESSLYDDSGDFEEQDDDVENDFKEMDSFFKPGRDLSLTDEFDIVFADSNSQKNIDEIRRQPIVKPNTPSEDRKKQKKF